MDSQSSTPSDKAVRNAGGDWISNHPSHSSRYFGHFTKQEQGGQGNVVRVARVQKNQLSLSEIADLQAVKNVPKLGFHTRLGQSLMATAEPEQHDYHQNTTQDERTARRELVDCASSQRAQNASQAVH